MTYMIWTLMNRLALHICVALSAGCFTTVVSLSTPTSRPTIEQVFRDLSLHRVPLRQKDRYCQREDETRHQTTSTRHKADDIIPYALTVDTISIGQLPTTCNFLASQVWPSARVAAQILYDHGQSITATFGRGGGGCGGSSVNANTKVDSNDSTSTAAETIAITVCELGCGPGLPSIAMACHGRDDNDNISNINNNSGIADLKVIATDVDELALQLVQEAATQQNLDCIISTRIYDLVTATWDETWMDDVDLWIMSDVFESAAVARGAALLTHRILSSGGSVWVFAQSDRAQRQIYVRALKDYGGDIQISSSCIDDWSSTDSFDPNRLLWLCDLDETRVDYG